MFCHRILLATGCHKQKKKILKNRRDRKSYHKLNVFVKVTYDNIIIKVSKS